MTKDELSSRVCTMVSCQKNVTTDVINAVFECISGELSEGGSVSISGFGVFKTTERAPKLARNPRTGDEVFIPQRTVPVFKPGKNLKEVVAKGAKEWTQTT